MTLRPLGLRLAPLLGASVIGTLLGIPMLTSGHSLLPPLLLGTVLLLYAMTALYLRPFQVPMNRQGWGGPVVGGLTGVLAGATGINAVPLVPYLNSIGLSKDELVQALGLCFTVSTLSLAGALVWKGQFPSQLFFASMAAVLPALMGMSLGQRARGRVSSAAFRRWFLYAMLAMGAYMALRASWKLLA